MRTTRPPRTGVGLVPAGLLSGGVRTRGAQLQRRGLNAEIDHNGLPALAAHSDWRREHTDADEPIMPRVFRQLTECCGAVGRFRH